MNIIDKLKELKINEKLKKQNFKENIEDLRKLNKKTKLRILVTAVALLILLSMCRACGDSGSDTALAKLEGKQGVTEFPSEIKKDDLIGIVHFSGVLLSDKAEEGWFDVLYFPNGYSEILPVGEYGDMMNDIPLTIATTFDAIAIPDKTRLVIYEDKNMQGNIVLDETGPLIIQNIKWLDKFKENDMDYHIELLEKDYVSELQKMFPQSRRKYSDSDMNGWQIGSCVISKVR